MNILEVIILAISSNLDDLGVGFSLGIRNKIDKKVIVIIAFISAITMLIGLLGGHYIGDFLSNKVASAISAIVFFAIGFWFIIQGVKEKAEEEISIREWTIKGAVYLGFALGIDSISLGLSAGLVNYPILLTTFFAGISSFILIWLGSSFANKIAVGVIREKANYISALLLIFLGIMQLYN